jgi:hypothetical protein
MAQSGRSWNDSRSPRPQSGGSAPGGGAGGAPSGNSGSARASWRDKSAPAVAQRGGDRHWQVSRAENPNRRRHLVKLGIAAAALLTLVGWFLYITIWGPRNTPLLLVGVLDYAAPLPPNAWTAEDFARFRSTFLADDAGSGNVENIRVYSDMEERQWQNEAQALLALEQRLSQRDMRPGGPKKRTVLIYLSGHGILDADGQPCLLLATDRGSADVWQPQLDRLDDLPILHLQKVLDIIGESYDDNVNKIVLLDCNRIEFSPQLGILENRFGTALTSLQFKDENLFVLNSAGAGQLGWTLPDRRASAFGYYVCKGLQGRADDQPHGGDEDGIVTLDELHRYLRKQVAEQVQGRYLAAQTPMLLSATNSDEQAADTPLAWSHEEEAEEASAAAGNPPVAWADVDALWSRHDVLLHRSDKALSEATRQWLAHYKLEADRPVFFRGADLLSWEAFQQGLLRLEQLNDAGRHYENEAERLAANLKLLADDLERRAQTSALPAEISLRHVTAPANLRAQVEQFILQPPKEPDKAKEMLAAIQSTDVAGRAKASWDRWLNWARAIATSSDAAADYRRTISVLQSLAGGSTSAAECDPVEIRFLRLLDPNKFAPSDVFEGQALALRSAILSRDLAEAAAWAADDVRAHYAVELIVDRGDQARRKAEDGLFIGGTVATGRVWKDAEEHYKSALELAVELSAALDTRDQVWQETPYLARWLVLRHGTDSQRSDVAVQLAACKELLVQNRKLAADIEGLMTRCLAVSKGVNEEAALRFATELKESRPALTQLAQEVRRKLDALDEFHSKAISDCRGASAADVLNLRRIHDLLSTPLLTGEARGELRQSLLRSRRNVQALVARGNQQSSEFASAQKSVPIAQHPLLALFADDSSTLSSDPGRLSGKLRTILHGEFEKLGASSPTDENALIQRGARTRLSGEERQARSFAAMWTLNPAYKEPEKQLDDPIASVEEFDRHHAIIWQAGRALDDFWGKEGDPQNAWYFDSLTALALREAKDVGPGDRSAAYNATDAMLIERRQVARQWVQFSVPSVRLPANGDARTVAARPLIALAEKIPQGEAAFIARQPDSKPASIRYAETDSWNNRLAVATPPGKPKEQIAFQLPATLGETVMQPWPLALFYRGHVAPTTWTPTRLEPGPWFELVRKPAPPPRVIVKGERRDPGAVSFIFDCSGSMGERLPRGGLTVMQAAKSAFRSAIAELASAEAYRVSLWFYGHRFRYSTTSKQPVNIRSWYAGNPEKLARIPAEWGQLDTRFMKEDVALEWPFDPTTTPTLTMQRLPQLEGLLDAAEPMGFTPLYYSIIKAVTNDPNLKARGAPRRLIVLTDGKNDVYENDGKRAQSGDTEEDVVGALQGAGIDFHIIGFGEVTREDQYERTLRQNILSKIGQGENYHEISPQMTELEEVIRAVIGLKRYEVRMANQPTALANERVNREVELKDHRGRQQYSVQIVGSDRPHGLTLEGGEAITLFVVEADTARPRLVHERYTREMQRNSVASTGGAGADTTGEQKFFIGFHQPLRDPGFMQFPISIQNSEATLFSPRPVEAWVEITPIGHAPADKVKPMVFYDLEFADGRPVPVLMCRAMNWPAAARRARINLFFKMQRTEPVRRPVRDVELSQSKPHPDLDVSLPNGRKVQFVVKAEQVAGRDGAQVTVIEQCQHADDLHQAKVEVETPANMLRREEFHSAGQYEVRHEFVYSGKVTDDLRDFQLRITSRQELERNAIKLHDVVEVEVDR